MVAKRIGILGFEGVTALDMVGPAEAFSVASAQGGGAPRYEVITIGATGASFVSESGLSFRAHAKLEAAPAIDTLIIPGGHGLREAKVNQRVARWVRQRARRTRRMVTVCTGIYGLAPTGLLDGRRVTTHWQFAADVARRFPALRVEPNALFIKDGPFYTSAGITAGIDLSLALIEEDFGQELALAVARELVVYLKRPGGQEQYSGPLRFQSESTDRFAGLAAWIAGHLDADLSIEALSKRACVSPRHFSRLFKDAFGKSPASLIEQLRLDEARRRLAEPRAAIKRVALSVGFSSADVFRRAFTRRFGVVPGDYRGRFDAANAG
jgi:transcriptional regulator GlxA family with amidase domain